MSFLAPHLVGRIPIAALANPPALIELFAETIVEELDFRLEAENMLDIGRVLAETDQRAIVVPRPHPRLVTRAGARDGAARRLRLGRRRGDAGAPGSTPRRCSAPGWSPSSRARCSSASSTATCTAATSSSSPTAASRCSTSASPAASTSRGVSRSCASSSAGRRTTSAARSRRLKELGALPADADIDAGDRRPRPRRARPGRRHRCRADELTARAARPHQAAPRLRGADAEGADAVREGHPVPRRRGRDASPPTSTSSARCASIATYFADRYGGRIADEIGHRPARRSRSTSTGCGPRSGLSTDTEHLNYRELQERREVLRRKFERREP